jgi:hypothetical protein
VKTQRERYAYSEQAIRPKYPLRFVNRALRIRKMLEKFAEQDRPDRLICKTECTSVFEPVNAKPFPDIAAKIIAPRKIASQIAKPLVPRKV